MNNYLWIGLDLGTTGIRCVVFDSNFNIASSVYTEYPLIFKSNNYVEQDAGMWFDITKKVIKEAADKIENKHDIKGMSISSQGISIVPTDESGKELMNAISWLDLRGDEFLPTIAKKFSPSDIIQRTGKVWSGAYTLPKLIWLKENEPEIYNQARYFLMPMDYLIARMTGKFYTDHTMAGGTMLYNINTCTWDSEIAESFGIDLAKLPTIKKAGTEVGGILPSVLKELGLETDVKLYIGAQDQKCAAFGAGLSKGKVTISLGTSAAMTAMLDEAYSDPKEEISSFTYLFGDKWVAEGVINTAGAALRWFNNHITPGLDYKELDEKVEERYPSQQDVLFFPELSRVSQAKDEDFPHVQKNIPVEPSGVFWGLRLETNAFDMGRAVMESIAFEIQHSLNQLKNSFPHLTIDTIRLFGGGANSGIWRQMIADVTGAKVELLSNNEMAATGAAMLAALGSKHIENKNDAAKKIKVVNVVEPIEDNHILMHNKYKDYLKIRKILYVD